MNLCLVVLSIEYVIGWIWCGHVLSGWTVHVVAAVRQSWSMRQELSYTEHGGEQNPVVLHPGEILVELYRRSTERSEVVVNIYRGDEPVLTNTSVPASLVVRVVGLEPGQATPL